MDKAYKYRKVYYGKEKLPLLITRNISPFQSVNIDRIILPIGTSESELVFRFDEKYKNILEYIVENELNLENILKLIISIGELLSHINRKGYIVGSLDLEDIVFNIDDEYTLFLRQTRPLFKFGDEFRGDYCSGKIKVFDLEYWNYKNLSFRSDVQLLGKILISILTNREITSYEELRYIAYNLRLFRKDIPVELQKFIDKITNIYPQYTYENINKSIADLKFILSYMQSKGNSISEIIQYSYICDVGKGKLQKQKQRGLVKNINQDRCSVYEKNNKIFAFVADGVSKCTYGSGYQASKIVSQVCKEVFESKIHTINTNEDILEFYKYIVNESNNRIIKYIKEHYPNVQSKDIMCTTFASALIIDNKLYIVSIGDSRVYLINDNISSALTIDNSYLNKKLKEGLSWSQCENLNNKSSLTNVIGSIDKNINFEIDEFIINKDDLIVLCSDGLTVYLADILDRQDDWKKQEILTTMIREGINNNDNISKINYSLVDTSNENGGFDNISSIIIKA